MKEIKYAPKYGVIVLCKDEKEQKEIYEKLLVLGLIVKVVCV